MKLSNGLMVLLYGVAGLGIYIYILYGEQGSLPSISQDMPNLFTIALVAVVSGVCIGLLRDQLERLIPWRKYFGLRFLFEWVLRMLIVAVALLGLTAYHISSAEWGALKEFGGLHQTLYLKVLVVTGFANILFI